MASRERTLEVVGSNSAGKATIIGCMLFKYGGVDMLTMQRFQEEGIRTYDQAANNLRRLKIVPTFDTPNHHITLADPGAGEVDCTILVLSASNNPNTETTKQFVEAARQAKQLIVLINRMDEVNWSEGNFQKIIDELGRHAENIPVIPISALNGDNVIEKSSKSPWYKGWVKNSQSGTTLLEALEISLQR